jgi:hypothetical protein
MVERLKLNVPCENLMKEVGREMIETREGYGQWGRSTELLIQESEEISTR